MRYERGFQGPKPTGLDADSVSVIKDFNDNLRGMRERMEGSVDRVESAKVGRAQIDAKAIASYVEQYHLDEDKWPKSLYELATPPKGGRPYLPLDKLTDPWGAQYRLAISKDPKTGEDSVEVYTFAPDKTWISNRGVSKAKRDPEHSPEKKNAPPKKK